MLALESREKKSGVPHDEPDKIEQEKNRMIRTLIGNGNDSPRRQSRSFRPPQRLEEDAGDIYEEYYKHKILNNGSKALVISQRDQHLFD